MTVKVTRHGQGDSYVFDRPNLLLVEGGDDSAFAQVQIQHLGEDEVWHIHIMGGNMTGWSAALEVILDDDAFERVGQSVGLLMDADAIEGAAFDRCAAALETVGFERPAAPRLVTNGVGSLRASIYLMPLDSQPGALEDLLLQAAVPERLLHAEAFLSGLEVAGLGPFSRRVKSLVQAYLASHPEVAKTLPVALHKACFFPVNHAAFVPFRAWLNELSG